MGSVKRPVEKKGLITKPQVPDKTSIDQGGGVVKGLMGGIVEICGENFVGNYCGKIYGKL